MHKPGYLLGVLFALVKHGRGARESICKELPLITACQLCVPALLCVYSPEVAFDFAWVTVLLRVVSSI